MGFVDQHPVDECQEDLAEPILEGQAGSILQDQAEPILEDLAEQLLEFHLANEDDR